MFATNPIDGVRTYFEDKGGEGPPILVYPGFSDPLEYAASTPLVQGLEDEFRLILADHRGQGRSDKPHDPDSYRITTRVADATAILDLLGIERVNYLGYSWGARLGYALAEHAPGRIRAMVLSGNHPYPWVRQGPLFASVEAAVETGRRHGIDAFVTKWEQSLGQRFPEPGRSWILDNDPLALAAEFDSTLFEGAISPHLGRWMIPMLIYAGAEDEMHDLAAQAAKEIPTARFLSLPRHDHFSAEKVALELLSHVRDLFRGKDSQLS